MNKLADHLFVSSTDGHLYDTRKPEWHKHAPLRKDYSIICGNAPYLNKTKKWANYECVRIAQTNSRRHGYSISTVWAVRGDK